MKSSEAIADETRRRNDDAVRRVREESRQRVQREARWRAFFAWCALTTLASGFALAALDARPAPVAEPPAVAQIEPVRRTEHAREMRPPRQIPEVQVPVNDGSKRRHCYLWNRDPFDPFARSFCSAWAPPSTRLHCAGSHEKSK